MVSLSPHTFLIAASFPRFSFIYLLGNLLLVLCNVNYEMDHNRDFFFLMMSRRQFLYSMDSSIAYFSSYTH